MNIKRYFAPDMRRAINLVRTEHGPDAVILSSDSVEGGVEIVAAVDYDPSLMTHMQGRGDSAEATSAAVSPSKPAAVAPQQAEPALATQSGESELPVLATTRELRAIQKEMFALKGLMRERFAWSDLRAMTPQRNWLMRRAEAFGLTATTADAVVSEVEHPEHEERAWREVVFGLARRLTVMREDPIDEGGVFALVGPTGVGKTTTIAKLAARHCLEHGRDSVALITTDNFRIGAHRQLDAFAAILGIPVRLADSADKLASLLRELGNRRLVLIDTAGVAPRDTAIANALAHLDVNTRIRRFLVLAANMQPTVMEDAVRAFGGKDLAGTVLTKMDETNVLGAAISVLIESQLPAVWLSDGQRVPEDLKLARVAHLLKRATVVPENEASAAVPAFMAGVHGAANGGDIHARL